MNALTIYHNPKCSKSRETLALLRGRGVEPRVIEYLKSPPTAAELRAIVGNLGIRAEQLVRKGEAIYRAKYAGKTLTEAEWIDALVKDPILIERPIVVRGAKAVIGRPPENVVELLHSYPGPRQPTMARGRHVDREPADISLATHRDDDAIRDLLTQSGLPTADLDVARPVTFVARSGFEVLGIGAIESFGTAGLLRSVAVVPSCRNSGLGREIVQRVERHARESKLIALFLLTETATPFFERPGYRVIERSVVPEPVQGSSEFKSLCPQSAVCMRKLLEPD